MRKQIAITILAVGMTLGLMSTASAQVTNQDSEVTINVSETVQLDARPSALAYGQEGTGISPGASQTVSDAGFEHIDIENIGSVPIEQIHAEATMHESNAFGDSGANDFDTGNFITMSTETANSSYNINGIRGPTNMHYLNRVEYAEGNPPEYLFLEESGPIDVGTTEEFTSLTDTDVGRFRVGEAEYFYVLYAGQSTTGTGDQWVLRIGETPHTPTQLGTVDFRNEDNVDGAVDYHEISSSDATASGQTDVSLITSKSLVSFDTGDSNGFTGQSLLDGSGVNSTALGEVTGAEERQYNLYIDGANDQIVRTSFNTALQSPQTDGSGNPTYRTDETNSGSQQAIFRSTTDGERLQPGQNFPINVGIQLPNGVDRTRVSPGTVSIIATETTNFT